MKLIYCSPQTTFDEAWMNACLASSPTPGSANGENMDVLNEFDW